MQTPESPNSHMKFSSGYAPASVVVYIRRLFLQHEGPEFIAYIVVNVFPQILGYSLLKLLEL